MNAKIMMKKGLGIFLMLAIAWSVVTEASTNKKHRPRVKKAAPSGETLWVKRSAKAQSCESDGEPLKAAEEELKKSGIQVLEARRGDDGMMHMQMCGADTGKLNFFKIQREDFDRARALGFADAPATMVPEKK